jgi:hypothetical protein
MFAWSLAGRGKREYWDVVLRFPEQDSSRFGRRVRRGEKLSLQLAGEIGLALLFWVFC